MAGTLLNGYLCQMSIRSYDRFQDHLSFLTVQTGRRGIAFEFTHPPPQRLAHPPIELGIRTRSRLSRLTRRLWQTDLRRRGCGRFDGCRRLGRVLDARFSHWLDGRSFTDSRLGDAILFHFRRREGRNGLTLCDDRLGLLSRLWLLQAQEPVEGRASGPPQPSVQWARVSGDVPLPSVVQPARVVGA